MVSVKEMEGGIGGVKARVEVEAEEAMHGGGDFCGDDGGAPLKVAGWQRRWQGWRVSHTLGSKSLIPCRIVLNNC